MKRHTTRSLPITKLLYMPIIRDDHAFEFQNKMTDDELKQWDQETYQILEEENSPNTFPERPSAYIAKVVDTQIIYDLFKQQSLHSIL